MLHTPRLLLIPGTVQIAQAELQDRTAFAHLIQATVPDNWPPETLADALPWFLQQLRSNPKQVGWFSWYCLLQAKLPVLIGSVGFKGAPDAAGTVEVGYSVLPQYQGQGYATEMVGGIVEWALTQAGVKRVVAETMPENLQSIAVLRKLGFQPVGNGAEPGSLYFESRKERKA